MLRRLDSDYLESSMFNDDGLLSPVRVAAAAVNGSESCRPGGDKTRLARPPGLALGRVCGPRLVPAGPRRRLLLAVILAAAATVAAASVAAALGRASLPSRP
jgi:hypothetical protein